MTIERRPDGTFAPGQAPVAGWKKGQSGNPEGRKTAGATMREWTNALALRPVDELRAVMEDDSAPVAKKAAAKELLGALRKDRLGHDRYIAAIEQTDGRAVTRSQVQTIGESPDVLAARLLEALGRLAVARRPEPDAPPMIDVTPEEAQQ